MATWGGFSDEEITRVKRQTVVRAEYDSSKPISTKTTCSNIKNNKLQVMNKSTTSTSPDVSSTQPMEDTGSEKTTSFSDNSKDIKLSHDMEEVTNPVAIDR